MKDVGFSEESLDTCNDKAEHRDQSISTVCQRRAEEGHQWAGIQQNAEDKWTVRTEETAER